MADTPARVPSDDAPGRPVAELEALHAAALALSQQLDPEAVLERIVEHAAALVSGSYGYLYVVDEAEGKLVQRIAQGPSHRSSARRSARTKALPAWSG